MADNERNNDINDINDNVFNMARGDRFWPLDEGVSCPGCPECDQAIAHFLHGLEADFRLISRDLWIDGWTPEELLNEVRWATGRVESTSLIAQLLLVDDAQRSEQARPPAWRAAIDALRSRTGIVDVADGWLTGWLVEQSSAGQASECLKAVTAVLSDLASELAA